MDCGRVLSFLWVVQVVCGWLLLQQQRRKEGSVVTTFVSFPIYHLYCCIDTKQQRVVGSNSHRLLYYEYALVLIDQLTLIPIMSSASSFESNIINGLIAFVNAHPPHNNNVIWTMKVIVCVGVEELVF